MSTDKPGSCSKCSFTPKPFGNSCNSRNEEGVYCNNYQCLYHPSYCNHCNEYHCNEHLLSLSNGKSVCVECNRHFSTPPNTPAFSWLDTCASCNKKGCELISFKGKVYGMNGNWRLCATCYEAKYEKPK
jgi:hypothetical protein